MPQSTETRGITQTLSEDISLPVPDEKEDIAPLVQEAVQHLPCRLREVLVLHYFSGLSHQRVAECLDISPQAVHGRLIRARRKLAVELKKMGWKGGSCESFRE